MAKCNRGGALEDAGKYDTSLKIVPSQAFKSDDPQAVRLIVPTLYEIAPGESTDSTRALINALNVEVGNIEIVIQDPTIQLRGRLTSKRSPSRLHLAIAEWVRILLDDGVMSIIVSVEDLMLKLPTSFDIYCPMLLLPSNFFASPEWTVLLRRLSSSQRQNLYKCMADATNATHVAVNAPITRSRSNEGDAETSAENIIRHPDGLLPLLGDFGVSSHQNSSRDDFDAALWVSTCQNGIFQTWSPLHTMFSRGNISEKKRILDIARQTQIDTEGLRNGSGWSAVDLYAGIGYFAFSYAMAGAATVFCWEINPWSIEGLKRGAQGNKWKLTQYGATNCDEEVLVGNRDAHSRILVFAESNVHAPDRIRCLRKQIAAIRHVNCGLLPSSSSSWPLAVEIMDPREGGWLHIHENIEIKSIADRSVRIPEEICMMLRNLNVEQGTTASAILQHVQRVKTFAPGIMHCVLDIQIIRVP